MVSEITKERCLEALTDCDLMYDVLYELINYRFVNTPLRFDELKAGMWVWDNKEKAYRKIESVCQKILVWFFIDYTERDRIDEVYLEDRFYRKQVGE